MSSPGKQTRGGTTALDVVDRAPGLRVLYVLASLKYLRYFQATLELLVERGHSLRLLLVEAPAEAREREWVARMRRHPNFAADQLDHFADDRVRSALSRPLAVRPPHGAEGTVFGTAANRLH